MRVASPGCSDQDGVGSELYRRTWPCCTHRLLCGILHKVGTEEVHALISHGIEEISAHSSSPYCPGDLDLCRVESKLRTRKFI